MRSRRYSSIAQLRNCLLVLLLLSVFVVEQSVSAHDLTQVNDTASTTAKQSALESQYQDGIQQQLQQQRRQQQQLQDDTQGGEFCSSMMPMNMYMDGFQWSSLISNKPKDCLIFLVSPWVLNDSETFSGSMIYTFLMAIIVEGITYLMGRMKRHHQTNSSSNNKVLPVIMSIVFGIQQFFGYIVMLITMTFSPEHLVSAIFGLMVGHIMFPRQFHMDGTAVRYRRINPTRTMETTYGTLAPSIG